MTVTASPSLAGKWLVLRLHRFQEQHPEIDVRISATDEVVDLTRAIFMVPALAKNCVKCVTLRSRLSKMCVAFHNRFIPSCSMKQV